MNGTRTTRPTLEDRFWSKVSIRGENECWPWTAYVTESGYGSFHGAGTPIYAHRQSFALANGRAATGDVDHACHNGTGCNAGNDCPHRACCNPAHLEDVPHRVNVQRGEAGKQSAPWKTQCIHGHAYNSTNQYIDPTGHQRCRRCASISQSNRRKTK